MKAGHHASPIAGPGDIERALREQPDILGVDLHVEEQLTLIKELAQYWRGLPDKPTTGWRYHSSDMFMPGDATIYYAMLQHLQPRRLSRWALVSRRH